MNPPAKSHVAYLDGPRLNRVLRAGIHRLLSDTTRLNRINVFPVPDGDTGTNLALTCGSIARILMTRKTAHAGKLLVQVADAALDGARGNSGAILAQFFQGLADSLMDRDRVSAQDLVRAFAMADEYARMALETPQEGTILTVISQVAGELSDRYRQGTDDLLPLIDAGLEKGRTALEDTRNGLEAMRKAGVVDAGASGFV